MKRHASMIVLFAASVGSGCDRPAASPATPADAAGDDAAVVDDASMGDGASDGASPGDGSPSDATGIDTRTPVDVGPPGPKSPETFSLFQELPRLDGGALGSEWENGEARIVKDQSPGKAGELFGLRWSDDTANLYLWKSADGGKSWQMVGTNPTNPCTSSCATFPRKIVAMVQDDSGAVHALASGVNGDQGAYYLRFDLQYKGAAISGFKLATPDGILLPSHGRSGTELRGDLKLVADATGKSTLVYEINLSTVATVPIVDIHVYMGRAATLTPTSASDFHDLNGAAGDSLVFNSCNYAPACAGTIDFSNHVHTALFAQNETSKDLWLFVGPIDADFGAAGSDEANKLRAVRLKASSTGWAVDVEKTVSTASAGIWPMVMAAASAPTHAWLMYLDPVSGVRFVAFDADGKSSDTLVPSPDGAPQRNGWGVFSVSRDEHDLWAIWDTLDRSGGSAKAGLGHWNGTKWSMKSDPLASDSMGMAGTANWNDGVSALLFTGAIQPQTYKQPRVATVSGY